MSNGVSWCPTSLFDLQSAPTDSDRFLEIESDGDVIGMWNLVWLDSIPDHNYVWKDVHPLIKARLRSALRQKADHFFLIEPELTSVDRALLVRKRNADMSQLIGCMYFHPPQKIRQATQGQMIRIINLEKTGQMHADDFRVYHPGGVTKDERPRSEIYSGSNPSPQQLGKRPLRTRKVAGNGGERDFIDSKSLHVPRNGTMKEVREQVEADTNLSSHDQDWKEILSSAAKQGNDEAVDCILQRFEESLIINGKALPQAEKRPTVGELLEIFDSKDTQSMTPLSWAAQGGYGNIVEKLLLWVEVDIGSTSRPPDLSGMPLVPRGQTPRGNLATPLYLAAERGHNRVVKLLINAGANISGEKGTEFPLHAASAGGHALTVELLLRGGASVDAVGTYNNKWVGSPLHLAVQNGHSDVVEVLLSRGANIKGEYLTDRIKMVEAAILNGHVKTAELLLTGEAGRDHEDGFLDRALQTASTQGQFETVELLLRKGADVNAQGEWYGNALQAASMSNDQGVLPWEVGNNGARDWGNSFRTVEMLLSKGADVNAQGGPYGNALQAASAHGHANIVELLLKNGAHVRAKGGQHGSALKAAMESGHMEVVKLLQSKGATRFHFG